MIQGSSPLYPQLFERGLLERLVLMVAPITLGEGKRLFDDGTPARSMKLVEQRTTAGGTLMATYQTAGALKTGSFATQEPSRNGVEAPRAGEGSGLVIMRPQQRRTM